MNDSSHILPNKNILKQATIQAIKDLGGEAKTKEINTKVAENLNLSEELLSIEDENGTGTMYEYRMRWIRTELKGKLHNPKRGYWILVED
ncbi:winged helix-turn-helix domain-containing protein [Bacillus sp. FJAT-47783]|uniref:winged helix-turn-helix domain-containing protein n=1 Tax=Bacillus sp. FJAT-47783 TaxID=2922712 RepID=UPI001FADF479|nr:winged helix-turn-helix domain-containing protein [Bacillus sp. FJAT-47783]